MTEDELKAIEAQLAQGGYGTMCKACSDRLFQVTAALREAWAMLGEKSEDVVTRIEQRLKHVIDKELCRSDYDRDLTFVAKQAAYERACALQCGECAKGDKPTWLEDISYFYHHAGTNLEIGCTASSIHDVLATIREAE